ncbi:hypothetical protein [Staphylococcus aureus]|nr:hypothetical protein [Staphylococcus aureus]
MNRNKLALQAHHMWEAVLAFCWYGLLWLTGDISVSPTCAFIHILSSTAL